MPLSWNEIKSRASLFSNNWKDKVWEQFWTGGLSNPIIVIEQIIYSLFTQSFYITQTQRE